LPGPSGRDAAWTKPVENADIKVTTLPNERAPEFLMFTPYDCLSSTETSSIRSEVPIGGVFEYSPNYRSRKPVARLRLMGGRLAMSVKPDAKAEGRRLWCPSQRCSRRRVSRRFVPSAPAFRVFRNARQPPAF